MRDFQNLRIYNILNNRNVEINNKEQIFILDFTLLGLDKKSPLYNKGVKESASYYLGEDLIVEKIFEDILDENNKLVSLQITFNWYNEDDIIGISKTEIVKEFNSAERKTELRKRRARAIDYLEASAEDKGFGWIIDLILTEFKTELDLFILSGSSVFKNAIISETTNENSKIVDLPNGQKATLSYILNQKLPPTELYPEGQTVAEGIIEEII